MASSAEQQPRMDNTSEEIQKPVQRKRLQLKPRDPKAAAKKEEERLRESQSASLFGDAKPREIIIADRVGKTEEDILKEEVKKEKLHLRLTPEQNQERLSHEAAVKEIEQQIESEADDKKKELLQIELDARQNKLDELMERFVNVTLEHAKSGEAPRMSQVRRLQQQQMQQEQIQVPSAPAYVAGTNVPQPHYNSRYNPTQQYHQNNQARGGYQAVGRNGQYTQGRGAGPHYYNNSNNSNTSAAINTRGGRGGMHQQRGRGYHGGSQNVPDWAREDPSPEMGSSGDINGGFYDGQQRQYGSRGERNSRQNFSGGPRRPQRETIPMAGDIYYQGPFPGRGVGGEIEFDSFTGQDRY